MGMEGLLLYQGLSVFTFEDTCQNPVYFDESVSLPPTSCNFVKSRKLETFRFVKGFCYVISHSLCSIATSISHCPFLWPLIQGTWVTY